MKIDVPPIVANAFMSWRTTLAGVLGFVVFNGPQLQAYFQQNQALDQSRFCFGLLVMVAMIIARDGTVSSEKAGAIQPPVFKPVNQDSSAGMPPVGMILILALCLGVLSGCSVARDKRVIEAEAKMVERYESHGANLKTVVSAYDRALLQAQTNFATQLHNERIAQIQAGVKANPADASDGIAAAAEANLILQGQIAQQKAVQDNIRAIVEKSEATNIVQARKLDAAIRNYDNTTPFNASAAVESTANTVQALIQKPTPIKTGKSPTKPAAPAPTGSLLPDPIK